MLLAGLCVLGDRVDPLLGTWQVDADVQASLAPIGEADIPVVLPYDGSGDRKAQPDTAGLGVTGTFLSVEGFEHLVPLARRDARPVVVDGDHRALGLLRQVHGGVGVIRCAGSSVEISALHLEGVDMEIGHIGVAWPATGQESGPPPCVT